MSSIFFRRSVKTLSIRFLCFHLLSILLAVQPLTPMTTDSDFPEVQNEISLTNRPVTILSTASLPPPPVKTLTPRRKPVFQDKELIYKLYKQCLTTSSSTKRSASDETPVAKKVKEPDLIILD